MKLWHGALTVGVLAVLGLGLSMPPRAQEGSRMNHVFEMRTYYTHPGKMKALHARFRDHTLKLFTKHGITQVGFWSPSDPEKAEQYMVYILSYPSKEAAEQSWKTFKEDPDWKKAKADSEKEGPILTKVESVFLNATDYSAIK